MSFARRYGGEGLRRGSRVPKGGVILPWSGFESDLILALDANLGIATETGVSQWSDQSSQGNHLLQATPSQQPAVSTNNGHPSVSFDGANDDMKRASATGFPNDGSFTFFAVSKWNGTGVNGAIFESSVGTTVNTGMAFMQENFGTNHINWRRLSGDARYTTVPTTTDVWEGTSTPTNRGLFQNGTSRATDNTTRTIGTIDHITIGALVFNGYYLAGHIHSLLVFSALLSAANRSVIRGRLGSRWGVAVS